jgi:hypothetical protein
MEYVADSEGGVMFENLMWLAKILAAATLYRKAYTSVLRAE